MDQHLQVFVTVAEKQNFSRAAEELHMTQPAVSQYIRALEESVGIRLLERTNKYVQLNKAGEIVYHHAKEILGLYTRMENLVADLTHKAKGTVKIGASYTFGEYVLPHLLTVLQKKYPEIEPAVTIANTASIAESVTSHQLDIGIVEGRFKGKGLLEEPFAEDEMMIVISANHVLAEKEVVAISDLEGETWIVREQGSGTREATDKMFEQFLFSPKKQIVFSSTQPIKEAVEAGLGISLLSKWAVQKEIRNKELQTLPIKGLPFFRQFSMITKSRFKTKALEVFIELLRTSEALILKNGE